MPLSHMAYKITQFSYLVVAVDYRQGEGGVASSYAVDLCTLSKEDLHHVQ